MILHDYWRSTASYRVRIALNFKGIAHQQVSHELRLARHRADDFLALNPHGLVPALDLGDVTLTQSGAIIEWMEEMWPAPGLLPANPVERAIVRGMAACIGCDIHPLNNLRVINSLRADFGASTEQVSHWIARWIRTGFEGLERQIERHGRSFAFGDEPSLADCYLVPQVYSAKRFSIDLTAFPRICAVTDRFGALKPVAAAHPSHQPDADAG